MLTHKQAICTVALLFGIPVLLISCIKAITSEPNIAEPTYSETEFTSVEETTIEEITIEPETSTEQETTIEEITTISDESKLGDERFISLVKYKIKDDVGKGEKITDIYFDEHFNLCIVVDITLADVPYGFDHTDIAVSRASSITDDILALNKDEYWNKIILDFGEYGKATRPKEVIVEESGYRYMPFERYNFK